MPIGNVSLGSASYIAPTGHHGDPPGTTTLGVGTGFASVGDLVVITSTNTGSFSDNFGNSYSLIASNTQVYLYASVITTATSLGWEIYGPGVYAFTAQKFTGQSGSYRTRTGSFSRSYSFGTVFTDNLPVGPNDFGPNRELLSIGTQLNGFQDLVQSLPAAVFGGGGGVGSSNESGMFDFPRYYITTGVSGNTVCDSAPEPPVQSDGSSAGLGAITTYWIWLEIQESGSELCPDPECSGGDCWCEDTLACVDCSVLPSCSEERECVWNSSTCVFDCIPPEEMCEESAVWSEELCACVTDTTCDPGECFCEETGLCVDCSETMPDYPSCFAERDCTWNPLTCQYDCTAVDEMCPPGQIFNEGTCACDDVPTPGVTGAGTWYHDLRVKVQVDRNDLFLPTGDRELRFSFVGQRPLIETVSLTPLAHTQIFPPAQAVAMVLEPEGAVLIRLKGRGGDIGTNITPAAPVASIPAFVPLDPAGVNLWLYNGATYTQTVRVRWLRTLQPEEEEPI